MMRFSIPHIRGDVTGGNTPIANYVNAVNLSSDVHSQAPQQKVLPFLKHLQQQLDRHCVNSDESALCTTDEGLFLQNPNVFQDFDMSYWKEMRIALVASGATVSPPKGKLWKLHISKLSGQKIIDESVIDLKKTELGHHPPLARPASRPARHPTPIPAICYNWIDFAARARCSGLMRAAPGGKRQ